MRINYSCWHGLYLTCFAFTPEPFHWLRMHSPASHVGGRIESAKKLFPNVLSIEVKVVEFKKVHVLCHKPNGFLHSTVIAVSHFEIDVNALRRVRLLTRKRNGADVEAVEKLHKFIIFSYLSRNCYAFIRRLEFELVLPQRLLSMVTVLWAIKHRSFFVIYKTNFDKSELLCLLFFCLLTRNEANFLECFPGKLHLSALNLFACGLTTMNALFLPTIAADLMWIII